MSYVVLDFETFYSQEYSLKKMTPPEYILDPRFEVLGCAIIDQAVTDKAFWMDGQALDAYLRGLAGRPQLTVLSHNALFDMSILSWKYNTLPSLMVDTLGMARALLYHKTGSVALDSLAAHYGLPPKEGALPKVKGMRAAEIKVAGHWDSLVSYAKHDAWLCEEIFRRMAQQFPRNEYKIMDMALRCAVVPRFQLDTAVLGTHLAEIEQEKQQLLVRAGVGDARELMSNDKFAAALRSLGIEPPKKISPITGRETYAFGKSDEGMRALADHPRQEVKDLVAARVGHKSTLEETRTRKLLSIAALQWPDQNRGWSPIALRYSGAHTHRFSGDWGLNAQNWTRTKVYPDGSKAVGRLRLAHRAPPGHLVVKCDASQIEARVVAWLSQETELLQIFRDKRDPYCEFGPSVYGREITKADVEERFVCKSAILGLGFQVGAPKFAAEIPAKSFITLGHAVDMPLVEAQKVVSAYRMRFRQIVRSWEICRSQITKMAHSHGYHQEWGPIAFTYQGIHLPNGLMLHYTGLQWVTTHGEFGGEWRYRYGDEWKRLYGGKVFENIVQALARIITMDAAVRMRGHGYDFAHQIHDDLIYIVPKEDALNVARLLEKEMSTSRDWYADLPLAAESGIGPSYGECK